MILPFTGSTLSFPRLPVDGDGFERHGQRYLFAGIRPHQRKDGGTTLIVDWRTRCAEPDCGAPFIVSTGRTGFKPPNRRCPMCVKPLVPASSSAAKAKRGGSPT